MADLDRLVDHFCRLSPPKAQPNNCAVVHDTCFDGEQIFLHGPQAAEHLEAIMAKINTTKDVYDVTKNLRPWEHRSVLLASPGQLYEYLPLAVNAQAARNAPVAGVPQVAAALTLLGSRALPVLGGALRLRCHESTPRACHLAPRRSRRAGSA